MELEKYIQQILWDKLPPKTGMQFYNTLPNNQVEFPYVKMVSVSSEQTLLAPQIFDIHATLQIVSDARSNIEVIDRFYELKKWFENEEFFDLSDSLVDIIITEPKFQQEKNNPWTGEFKITLKIITNFGESIC